MACLVMTGVGELLIKIVNNCYNLEVAKIDAVVEQVAAMNKVSSTSALPPFKAIVLPEAQDINACSALDYQALNLASELNGPNKDILSKLLDSCTGQELLALAQWIEHFNTQSELKGAASAILGVAAKTGKDYLSAVKKYDDLLKQYAEAPRVKRRLISRNIKHTFNDLQTKYQSVIKQMVSYRNAHRNTRFLKKQHAAKAYARHYGYKAISLNNSSDITRLRFLTNSARFLGPGAILLDWGAAGYNVKQAYDTGGNTSRVASVEVGGIIGGSVAAGIFIVITSAIGAPILVVAGAVATAAILGNIGGKRVGSFVYEKLITPELLFD